MDDPHAFIVDLEPSFLRALSLFHDQGAIRHVPTDSFFSILRYLNPSVLFLVFLLATFAFLYLLDLDSLRTLTVGFAM